MTLESSLTAISVPLAAALFAAVWQGVLLAACVELCLRLVPRVTAAARSAIWTVAFALVALLHFAPIARTHSTAPTLQPGLVHVDLRWSLGVLALWAALSLVRAVRLVADALRLHGIARRATPVGRSRVAPMLLAGRRRVELCTSDEVDRPSVAGFLHSRILIPPTLLKSLSPDELEQVLLHEMEHLRRADDWTNLIQKIAVALVPINPALLWIERRLCAERELACDDRVLHATGARKAYATCLANLAEHSVLRRGAALALRAWEHQSELTRRVHRILARPELPMSRPHARMVTVTLMAAVLGLGAALTRSPQLLTFTAAQPVVAQASGTPVVLGPTSFQAAPKASMKLLKADMPEPRAIPVALHARPRKHRSPLRNVTREQALRLTQPTLLMYTEWREIPQSAARLTLAVADDDQLSYAAVPTPNGWLIFQL